MFKLGLEPTLHTYPSFPSALNPSKTSASSLPMNSPPQPPAAASITSSRVSKSTVETAISALIKYKATQATGKLQLLPQDDYIYLNLTLKKIPSNPRTNPFRIALPHPILDPTSQICLIIDDRPQTPTPASDQIKKLIKSQNIPISKVIRLSKLKSNYKPFEAKRKLCDSYDLFLVDKRVVHFLPKLIGKEFFKKKKLPLGVDLSKKNLKLQVERALGSALLYLRSGTCCVIKVGKVSMENEEISENAYAAIQGAVERVPKKWDGVRSFHLKFYNSVALPVYQAMPDVKLKIEGAKERKKRSEVAPVSDSEGDVKEMSGRKSGKSEKKKKKGRIHEVRYMDIGGDVEVDGDDVDNDESMGQKRMEGNLMEEIDDGESDHDETKENGDEDFSIRETGMKRRNKRSVEKEGDSEQLSREGLSKKKAKSGKSEGRKQKKAALSGGEESGAKKEKKKTELGKRRSERIAKVKDTKLQKE